MSTPRRKRHRRPYPELPEDLPDKLAGLLGKSDQSEEFLEIIREIGKPSDRHETPHHRFYHFDQCGLALFYDQHAPGFDGVIFMFDTAAIRSGRVSRYQGNLPARILWSDNCLEVDAKLGVTAAQEEWVPGCSSYSCTPEGKENSFWKLLPCFH